MKQVHIQLPDELHQILKVECAMRNVTMRIYLTRIIKKELQKIKDEKLHEDRK